MDRQQSFLDPPATGRQFLAANADPGTSHAAAAALKAGGEHGAQKRQVLAALRGCDEPVTSRELAAIAEMDRHLVARRLPDLAREGLVVRCAVRECRESYSHAKAVTWKRL